MPRVWLDGSLVDQGDAKISVFDHGLLYGDGCFEGIRAYNGRIFKMQSHLSRMYASAAKLRLTPAYDEQQIESAMRETLSANGLTDAYIRLVFTRGVGTLGLNPLLCPTASAFIIADKIQLYPPELYENGMAVVVAKRRRVPIEALDPALKSLNYLNNVLAKLEAIDAGVLEAIMLNTDGLVSECTGDNIFIIKDGTISTPDTGAGILHGITRQFVVSELAPSLGLTVRERLFELDELLDADEIFLTGTAAEIIGVSKVDKKVIGDGRVGPVTQELVTAFRQTVVANAPED